MNPANVIANLYHNGFVIEKPVEGDKFNSQRGH